jgi:cytoskeletal protein CcmA (bactofilin family)
MFGREKEKAATAAPQAVSAAQNTYGAGPQGRATNSSEGQMPKMDTVLGANCRFSGTLQSDGGVRVDGIFEGNLHTTGNVIVSESATIVAEIAAYNVTISGMVKGNITANKVEITETGKLWGDLNVNAILLHEGAYLEGQTNMANAVAPPMLEPSRLGRAPQLGAPSRGDAGKDEA